MFKVLIVDDEPIIRKGLINIVDWNTLGCYVCGEASDGVEGMDKITEFMPDIIVADIQMPGVDGLTMIRRIKELIPYSKFIILTGYRDFEYMQEAIRLGAFDYILKPSKVDEISSIIRRAVIELRYGLKREEETDEVKRKLNKAIPALKEKFIYDVMFRIIEDPEDIESNIALYNLKIDTFILLVMEFDETSLKEVSSYDIHLNQFGIINIFEEMSIETFIIEKVAIDNTRISFIVQPKIEIKDFKDKVCKKVGELQDFVRDYLNLSITVAVSSIGRGVLDLPEKMSECLKAIEYKMYMGQNSIILYEDLKSFFKEDSYPQLEEYQKSLIKAITSGNEQNVKDTLCKIEDITNLRKSYDEDAAIKFYHSVLLGVLDVGDSMKDKSKEIKDMCNYKYLTKYITKRNDAHELHDTLVKNSLLLVREINSYNCKNINIILQRAITFINCNYMKPITLSDVAEHTYVSVYYLSRMFKKELDKNFVDYLNEIRIEKSKELLIDGRYKNYEVAEMVGINDAHYFSKLFKKYTGMTPTEYISSLT